ncbi:hypothetical protein [Streptomyces olivoreticuli]|uniref:hypothetical protein n=1 Tax=Streptomyces olivoreticuli TaxID=68246 RepID=UPI0013C31005|nr:hypothetical protein [Streptomyces olivoreticuli]
MAIAVITLRRPAINNIRRVIAAVAAGIMFSLGSVVAAAPAHADNELPSFVCAVVGTIYVPAKPQGCP